VGRSVGTFDLGDGEKEDFRSALEYMAARYPGARLWAAGFSFGAWVALEVGAADDRVAALIGIAPPVATSVSGMTSGKPKFFVQGEADEVCPLQGMWAFYGQLDEPKELVVIDAADHLFEGKTSEVGEALEDLLADF
jgi:alpha/beta superfamily hydrolase